MLRISQTANRRGWLAALAVVCLAYGVHGLLRDRDLQGEFLWDLDYYRAAAARWDAGADPYLDEGEHTGYYYSPTATPLLSAVFLDFDLEPLYWLLTAAAIGSTLWLALRVARPRPSESLLCALYALSFGGAEALYTLGSGNLAWLVSLLGAFALWAASTRRWTLFYALVGLSSLLKPYSLALLVIPFVLRVTSPAVALAIGPLVVEATVTRIFWPSLVASRTQAIWQGVIEPMQLRYTVTGRLSRLLNDWGLEVGTATALALAVQLGLLAVLVLLARARLRTNDACAFNLATVAAFAAIPRMAGYDAYLFGPAIFVLFRHASVTSDSRAARITAMIALGVGLLKEGLVVLPALTVVWLLLSRSGRVEQSPTDPKATEFSAT